MVYSYPRASYILYTYIFGFCLRKSNTEYWIQPFSLLFVEAISPSISRTGPTDAAFVIILSSERLLSPILYLS